MGFMLGQMVHLRLVTGRLQCRVIATGGGYTTVLPTARLEDGKVYMGREKPRCLKDEDLEKELV